MDSGYNVNDGSFSISLDNRTVPGDYRVLVKQTTATTVSIYFYRWYTLNSPSGCTESGDTI